MTGTDAVERDTAVPADLVEAGKMADECFEAVSGEGPRAYDWTDKPHRLVYDMYGTIRSLIALATAQAALIAERDAARDAALEEEAVLHVVNVANDDAGGVSFPPEADGDFDTVNKADIAKLRAEMEAKFGIGQGRLTVIAEPKISSECEGVRGC